MSKRKKVITLALDKISLKTIDDASKQLSSIAKALHKVGIGMQNALKRGLKPTSTE